MSTSKDELYILKRKFTNFYQEEYIFKPPKLDRNKKHSIPTIIDYMYTNKQDAIKFVCRAVKDCIRDDLTSLIPIFYSDFGGRYVYTWGTLEYILNSILKHTADQDVFDKIFDTIHVLAAEIEKAKMQVKMDRQELKILQAMQAYQSKTKIISIMPPDDAAEAKLNCTWDDRFILDALQLQQRSIECKYLQATVFEKIQDLTRGLRFQEERMADIKDMQRAHVKLEKYTTQKQQELQDISSSLYDAKDMLRLSYVCNSADETKAVFEALTGSNSYFTVYRVKNGFVSYQPGNYCDIKVILKSTDQVCEEFEELVEVQLIQSMFIRFKKAEHRIYEFIRAKSDYLARLIKNQLSDRYLRYVINNEYESKEVRSNATELLKTDYYNLQAVKAIVDLLIAPPDRLFEKTFEDLKTDIINNPKIKNYLLSTNSKIICDNFESYANSEIKNDIDIVTDLKFTMGKYLKPELLMNLATFEFLSYNTLENRVTKGFECSWNQAKHYSKENRTSDGLYNGRYFWSITPGPEIFAIVENEIYYHHDDKWCKYKSAKLLSIDSKK